MVKPTVISRDKVQLFFGADTEVKQSMAGRAENPDIFFASVSERAPCTIPGDFMSKFNDSLFSADLALIRNMRIFDKKSLSNSTLDGFRIPFFLNFSISRRFIRMIIPPLGGGSSISNLDARGRGARAFIRAKVKMSRSVIRKNGLTFPAWPFPLDFILSFIMPLGTAKIRTKPGSPAKGLIQINHHRLLQKTGMRLIQCFIMNIPDLS